MSFYAVIIPVLCIIFSAWQATALKPLRCVSSHEAAGVFLLHSAKLQPIILYYIILYYNCNLQVFGLLHVLLYCLWYVDKNGTWHNGFDCPLITFCCGNCHRRYCCLDGFKMITEAGQKRCMLFHLSPSTIAGIASSILLFVAAIATMVCCFMCSCCYLYQRRQQRGRTPYEDS
ncbi:protein shisa-4-like [Sinocyclocheilus grahami]|uniref:protein shisa-4-like n=1 Tax=Sinocyclocheilus grahami TaxID=75366 RepID=UPI0007ACAAF6|nr:PREDICTED: protein shisa-4-like [Sinocyclocheilus grahami]